MKNQIFSTKILLLFIACAVILFALSILLSAYDSGEPMAPADKVKPGSYASSAIGYAGFYDTMRRLDMPVMRGVSNIMQQVGVHGTLIVASPDTVRLTNQDDAARLANAPRVLFVLPKWRGIADDDYPRWLADMEPMMLFTVQQALSLVTDNNSIVIRDKWPENWQYNEIGITPFKTAEVVQMISSDQLRPVVGTREGMLVGEIINNNKIIWVLSDPDIMSNAGFGKGDNGVFMITLIGMLRHWNNTDSNAPIVFDEIVHGVEQQKSSPARLIVTFPFSIIVILVCLTAIFAVMTGIRRFGAPRRPQPNLDFGKLGLINNGARLLDYAGHHTIILQRYVRMTIRSVGQNLHAPNNLSDAALAQWLDRIGKTRKLEISCASILSEVTKLNKKDNQTMARLFKSAVEIHTWKGEMLNGSTANRRDS